MREGLLYGIGFLSAFLSGAEIGFFRSVFLETTAMASIVHRVRAPMLLAKVACFSVRAFLGTLGLFQYQVATYPFYRCAKVSRHGKRRTCWIFPSYIPARLPRETEGANACPHESHLSCEGWTDPATCTGTFVTRWISLGEGAGARAEQYGTCPQQPFSLWPS